MPGGREGIKINNGVRGDRSKLFPRTRINTRIFLQTARRGHEEPVQLDVHRSNESLAPSHGFFLLVLFCLSPFSTRRQTTVCQWLAGPSFNQGIGGSIPALVDVSLRKTLDPVDVSKV